ncbi:MAG TPA: hypothetical protein VMC10_23775, partial [Stellaceae bacterium]|nr:hypothetical protein [Stellaceae bacterium]
MEKFDLGTVIAERRFLLPDGKRITVKIGMPRRLDDGNFFSCPYKILGVQKEVTRRAGGIDAVQAIQSAFQNIGSLLSVLNELYGNALAWEGGEKGDLGFPLPQ